MGVRHVVSFSGGKDSTATLLTALSRFGRENVVPVFCDTGNEHAEIHDYLRYIEESLGIQILRLKANFDAEIAAKRMFVARDQRVGRKYDTEPVFDAQGNPVPKRDGRGNILYRAVKRDGLTVQEPIQKTRKVGGGRRVRWTNRAKRRALEVLHPTGNPYLDLCLWKGRFPSRLAQFCTQELKRNVMVEYQLGLVDSGYTVVSWQGIRRDESPNRRNAKQFEKIAPHYYIYRPLVEWSALDVFDYCGKRKIQPNPLYLQGFSRVGCMPCINCSKKEIWNTHSRAPEYLEQKKEWEILVSKASKRGYATFFNKDLHQKGAASSIVYEANKIDSIIIWSRTTRGGKQFDILSDIEDPMACSSSYGLCE
ncbi:phosphoadenosine phosphosulfate reductase family protein [Acidithiobacillus montserratensis]|uniref:Phosphoadenosine phosphosulfate reductase family protein n=1 Tax=Acidithiobacillus montserratensis TaxID=2729135 RepID=A0ACD5HJB7_9PROT|nr:phosphoadenosine phosphosulfate reductase family protein [Acidithiobacillus montserratensis]MBU2746575.1 phosphoadenosine phosphosulfate reductase family protein [Acidithiobacillus montserratensis]